MTPAHDRGTGSGRTPAPTGGGIRAIRARRRTSATGRRCWRGSANPDTSALRGPGWTSLVVGRVGERAAPGTGGLRDSGYGCGTRPSVSSCSAAVGCSGRCSVDAAAGSRPSDSPFFRVSALPCSTAGGAFLGGDSPLRRYTGYLISLGPVGSGWAIGRGGVRRGSWSRIGCRRVAGTGVACRVGSMPCPRRGCDCGRG